MISIQKFVFNPFSENTYLLFDETRECVVIDPGCANASEEGELKAFIEKNKLNVTKLINTHCHIDHVLGNYFVKSVYDVPLIIHKIEETVLRSVVTYASAYGFPQYQEATADEFTEEGELLTFGTSSLEVIFVPGHSPGHIVLVNKAQKICIGGDVLFNRSIGRTDLPGGDHDTLITSIRTKVFPLEDDMIVYPGHGPETTVGEEKKYNPFCALTV